MVKSQALFWLFWGFGAKKQHIWICCKKTTDSWIWSGVVVL